MEVIERAEELCRRSVKNGATVQQIIDSDTASALNICAWAHNPRPDSTELSDLLLIAKEQYAAKNALTSTNEGYANSYVEIYPNGIYFDEVNAHRSKSFSSYKVDAVSNNFRSIAGNKSNKFFASSSHLNNTSSDADALYQCSQDRNAKTCLIVSGLRGEECFAYAYSNTGEWKTSVGASRDLAKSEAYSLCDSAGGKCTNGWIVCANGR